MVPLSYVSQLHFPLSKLSCHKLQEKIIMKLVIILSLNTNHQSGWTLILILMIAIYFLTNLDTYEYFFHIIGKLLLLCQSHPCQILPISSCYFPSQQLMQNNCPIRSQANTTKILQRLEATGNSGYQYP